MATQVGSAYVEIGAKIHGLERGLKDASRQFEAFGRQADRQSQVVGARFAAMGDKMAVAGRKLTTRVTLPILGIGVAAFKMAGDFERSMSKITGLVGIQRDQVNAMRKDVLALSRDTGKSAKDLADGLFVVTSAGLRGEDAINALRAAGKAATAGLGEVNDIGRAVAGAMNAYGSATLDAAKATDIVTATARAGNFETSALAASLGRVLPFAKQAGASFEQVGGAVALLTRTNGDAAQSVTQVASLLRGFVTPTAQARKVLAEYGLSAKDVRDSIGKDGLVPTLRMLDKRLGGNRETLAQVIGRAEGTSAAFQILDADAKTLRETFGVVEKSVGLTDDAFAAASDTAQVKMQKAIASLQASLIEIGGIIAPAVTKIAGFISRLVGAFTSLPGPIKSAVVAFASLAAVMGPVLWIGGKMIGTFGRLAMAMAGLGGAKAAVAGVGVAASGAAGNVGLLGRALPALGMAGPMGAVVAGVGIGIAALFAFRNTASATERAVKGMDEATAAHRMQIAQINQMYPQQTQATRASAEANDAAKKATDANTVAQFKYLDALTKGRAAGETRAQFLSRLAGLEVAAAQAGAKNTAAANTSAQAARTAADGALKLAGAAQKEVDTGRQRVDAIKKQVTAYSQLTPGSQQAKRASEDLAQAQADLTLAQARQVSKLKESRQEQIAAREAVKKSAMSDAEKRATVDNLNRSINKTTREIRTLDGAKADPKITADTSKAKSGIDEVKQRMDAIDKFVTITFQAVKKGFSFGGMVKGFASGGKVRGPGGKDRVPAMLTAGEVVLTKRQQSLVDGGMSIGGALRKTGAAFAKGGSPFRFTPPKQQKGEDPKAYRKRVAQARKQAFDRWKRERDQMSASGIQSAMGAFTSNRLAEFDRATQARTTAIGNELPGKLKQLEKDFEGTFTKISVDASGKVVQVGQQTVTSWKGVMRSFEAASRAAFRAFEIEQRKAQKAMNATFDALTASEAKLKALQDAGSQDDLQSALAAAQSELADIQRFGGSPQELADAQKKVREAERAMMISELQKTAEAERAQRETEREAAQDDFNATWEEKRAALQDALSDEQELLQGAYEHQQQMAQQAIDERIAAEEAARANEREALEGQLMQLEANLMARRTQFRRYAGDVQRLLGGMARRLEISGRNIGKSLADGLAAAKGDLRGAAKTLADMLSDWLKTSSPTEKGPMSTLDTWWAGLAPALVGGIDNGAMERGLAKAAALEGAVAVSGSRMSASAAGSVINLTVSDNTLAGMSREQADRVASQIKASLDRQIRAAI